MKKSAFLVILLLCFQSAWADSASVNVDLSDGRICKGCTIEIKKGFIISVKDKTGEEWIDPEKPLKAYVTGSSFWSWSSNTYTTPAGAPPSQDLQENLGTSTSLGKPTWAEFKPRIDLGLPYWTKREAQFNQEMALCESTTTDKAMCYMQVRQLESQKNSMHRLER